MTKGSRFDYFDAFERIGTFADEEADSLLEILTHYDPTTIHEKLADMHETEHAADLVNHEVYTHIISEFITPIDREDIMHLTNELDEIVDQVEDVLQRMYMFNIQTIIPEALEMVTVVAKSTEALRKVLVEFSNYKKSKSIADYIIEVNAHEEEADQLYIEGMHSVFTKIDDPILVIAWSKIFDRIERCADSCEHAADAVNTIIMKNS